MTVKVAVVGAGPLLGAGLDALLRDEDWITIVTGDPWQADVVIYDVIGMGDGSSHELVEILDAGVPILALGRPLRPDLAARAIRHGAAGTLSTEASLEDILIALRDIAGGREMSVGIHDASQARSEAVRQLTPREVTVLSGISRGLSNAEICSELFIGINTLKSVIRAAHRKIGVDTRPQAVAWCLQHGFDPQGQAADSPEDENTIS